MDLGVFSVSLAVKDIRKSKEFYEKLGFEFLDGNIEENWVILKHESVKIGLFQGMFDANILTWNPSDARTIQKELKAQGLELTHESDEEGTGPAYLTLKDPDGNPILIDQH